MPRCETLKVIRNGDEVIINKEDLQKSDKLASEKPKRKTKAKKDAE